MFSKECLATPHILPTYNHIQTCSVLVLQAYKDIIKKYHIYNILFVINSLFSFTTKGAEKQTNYMVLGSLI